MCSSARVSSRKLSQKEHVMFSIGYLVIRIMVLISALVSSRSSQHKLLCSVAAVESFSCFLF